MRSALAHVTAKQRLTVTAMIKTIFAQEPAADAHAQWKSAADALRKRAPKLAELMDEAREDVLAYIAFRKEHWLQNASTNPFERLNGEVKRRSNVVVIFPNDRAVIRLVGALMLEQNDNWAVSRRSMSLESLTPVTMIPSSGCQKTPPDHLEPYEDHYSYITPWGTIQLSAILARR